MKVILLIALCAVAVMASPAVRQSGNTCTSSSDCVPASIFNETNGTVPQALIACNTNTGVCVCSDCFMLNATANQCYLMPPCTDFDVARMECQDTRRKQLTAFLLAFFLTTFGAANFYVDRLEFAIPQLILGIIFICCSCANTCTRQCAKDSDNTTLKVGLCLHCWIAHLHPVFLIPCLVDCRFGHLWHQRP